MTEAATTDTVDVGDHACLTFTDREERLDLVAAFVRDGLRAGLKVVCWTDAGDETMIANELAARAVRPGAASRRGQLRLGAAMDTALDSTVASGMIDKLVDEVDAAAREGYPGLRVTADMNWATRPSVAADQLVAFEEEVARLFTDGRLCLICQYDRERFDAVTLAFAAKSHQKTIAAVVYYQHPLLRICRQYSPPGVRVAGQLDYQHREELARALAESLRLDRHMHLNLTGLEYLDGMRGVHRGNGKRLAAITPHDSHVPSGGCDRPRARRGE